MEDLLQSKDCPTGQDYVWHQQVLFFMNWQITMIKNNLIDIKKREGIYGYTRRSCAMNVAIGYQKGKEVQERIMKHERGWIQNRKIPLSRQGKHAKIVSMLEDEGTIMAVHECIASAGQSK